MVLRQAEEHEFGGEEKGEEEVDKHEDAGGEAEKFVAGEPPDADEGDEEGGEGDGGDGGGVGGEDADVKEGDAGECEAPGEGDFGEDAEESAAFGEGVEFCEAGAEA